MLHAFLESACNKSGIENCNCHTAAFQASPTERVISPLVMPSSWMSSQCNWTPVLWVAKKCHQPLAEIRTARKCDLIYPSLHAS